MTRTYLTLLIALTSLCSLTACHFVTERDGRITYYRNDVSLGQIDRLIERVLQAKEEGHDCRKWLYRNDDSCILRERESWDDAIGELHAIRSICIVSHSPIYFVSGDFFSLCFGLKFPDGVPFFVPWVLSIPIDIVQLPVQLTCKTVCHLSVSGEKLSESLQSLSVARELGFDEKVHHKGYMHTPLYYFLDRIGWRSP